MTDALKHVPMLARTLAESLIRDYKETGGKFRMEVASDRHAAVMLKLTTEPEAQELLEPEGLLVGTATIEGKPHLLVFSKEEFEADGGVIFEGEQAQALAADMAAAKDQPDEVREAVVQSHMHRANGALN